MNNPFPFSWGTRTFVMGIVNCSPDSFSGDGIVERQAAIDQGVRFVEEGADILDVGGESTRPGSDRVDAGEEQRRVVPVIEGLSNRVSVPISVDTSRASVARASFYAGATILNDIWAFARDPDIAAVAAQTNAGVILMHNREARAIVGALGGHYGQVSYEDADIVSAVAIGLADSVRIAESAGIARNRIIVDPGIGFGKGVEQNLELLRRLREFKGRTELADLPLLVGTSRKSVIGLTLNLPIKERLEGTLATLALAIAQGVDIVRVHDVQAAVRCCRMADAIVRGQMSF